MERRARRTSLARSDRGSGGRNAPRDDPIYHRLRVPALRRLFRIDAFSLGVWVGLAFALLHLLDAASAGTGGELPVVSRVEHAAQDYALVRLRGPRPPSGRVVIVAIDEKSVEAEGLWPWSRARMARLVDALARGGVAAVGFDVLWADDDPQGARLARVASLVKAARASAPGPELARRLDEVWAAAQGSDAAEAADVEPTAQLAEAIERARMVTVGFMFFSGRGDEPAGGAGAVGKLRFFRTEPVLVPRGGELVPAPEGTSTLGAFAGAVAPVDEVLAVADSGGSVTVPPDPDGVIRRYHAVASAGGSVFPSLGVALLARVRGRGGAPAPVTPVGAGWPVATVSEVRVGTDRIVTDDQGRVPLNFYGRSADFPTWSATDVLRGRIPADAMRGRIAVVGTTAPGTWDQRVTPFDRIAPGVVTHATFVENVLRGELLERSLPVSIGEIAAMLGLAFGLAWVFSRVSGLAAFPALLAAGGAWAALAVLALHRWNVVLALGMPLSQMLAMFVASTTYRFFAEEREKRRARETFGRFLAPAIVDQVLAREGALRLGGEKRELTVLFSDIRGFTSIAEKLDPHRLLELLNEYLTPMTDIVVQEHQGTLDKYMGDAIMAFWGAPQAQPDHALRACAAALDMTARLDALRAGWRARGLPDVDVGVGINTGPMSVGFVGSQDRFYNYTVLGDAVNLASRLEGANKEYGTRIILGPATWEAARERVVARPLDLVRVKGKREPVRIHELLGLAPAPPEVLRFVEAFSLGLSAYQAQRWDEAVARFREADAMRGGDACARSYVARCERMRLAPPGPEWDGVFEMKTK